MHSSITTIDLPPESLRGALFARIEGFSMLPSVAAEALELSKDPDCDGAKFGRIVERDVALTSEVLSLANSVLFAGNHPVVTVEHAMVRLGLRQCRNLILSSSAASLMKILPVGHEWVREVLWQHSVATATASTHLNRALQLGFQGEEYTAGLLHDFGRMLLAIAAPRGFKEADLLDFEESAMTLEQERAVMGTDHAAFGAWFAEQSDLPTSLVAAIGWHHSPAVDHADQILIALTAAADHIANYIQSHGSADGYRPEENHGIAEFRASTKQRFFALAESLVDAIAKDVQRSW
ncbi:MAG: HDOD domain-containing protein [Planctomycetaceae bacterium]